MIFNAVVSGIFAQIMKIHWRRLADAASIASTLGMSLRGMPAKTSTWQCRQAFDRDQNLLGSLDYSRSRNGSFFLLMQRRRTHSPMLLRSRRVGAVAVITSKARRRIVAARAMPELIPARESRS